MSEYSAVLLSKMQCSACHKNTEQLNEDEIARLKYKLPDWQVVNESGINKLRQRFATKNYTRSMAFTNALANIANEMDHHPLMVVEYNAVTVFWWSHIIKGLHQNDFIMAAKTSALFTEGEVFPTRATDNR